jgi:hypothetical protein
MNYNYFVRDAYANPQLITCSAPQGYPTVAAAKIGSGDPQAGETPLAMLLGEFYKSLRPDQMGNVIQLLDMLQKIMFMEIVNLINPSEQKGGGGPGQSPGGPNGAA